MKTITVKLGGYDLEQFEELKERLSKTWIFPPTTSETIRYAIHAGYCFEVDKPYCAECYAETKERRIKNEKTNKLSDETGGNRKD